MTTGRPSSERFLATKNVEEWGEDKGVLITSLQCFKGLKADAIVTIEKPVSEDARVWWAPEYI